MIDAAMNAAMNATAVEIYTYWIVALLPLSACMLLFQTNPYHALVLRGILGAIAALVYAVLGAADVALTEALMGTMLAITLYAIAVRSSLVMRLGVLKDSFEADRVTQFEPLATLHQLCSKQHMRLELVPYVNPAALHQGLLEKEVHATCIPVPSQNGTYQTTTRLQHLYEMMQAELPADAVSYISIQEGPR
jgi:putative multicomponent Na+:H+ antiporter subunit B